MFHVVQQQNAVNNKLVPVTDTNKALRPSSVRATTRIISLTANNITYTKSNLLGWWYAYPIPDSIAAEYPKTQYMHAPGWGFAEVQDSTTAGITAGDWIFGYTSFSTLAFDLVLSSAELRGHYIETSSQRKDLVTFYNRSHVIPKAQISTIPTDDLDFTALLRALFGTGFDLANFVFAPKPEERVRPTDDTFAYEWSETNGDIKDAVVIVLGAAGKAALGFAHQLQHGRPASERPSSMVGVTSAGSSLAAERCGFYDAVYRYEDQSALSSKGLDVVSRNKKIVVVDFSSQKDAAYDWAQAMQSLTATPVVHVCITDTPRSGTNAVLALGPHITALAMERIGVDEYYKRYDEAFASLTRQRNEFNLEVIRKEGLQEFQQDFSALAEGQAAPTGGLVYHL